MIDFCQREIAKVTTGNLRGFRSVEYLKFVFRIRNFDYFLLHLGGWLSRSYFVLGLVLEEWFYLQYTLWSWNWIQETMLNDVD